MKTLIIIFLLISPLIAEVKQAPVSGRSILNEALLPADVLARVSLVSQEIEEIRKVMGKPRGSVPAYIVNGASPRHVYHQAEIMYQKVNLLCNEFNILPVTQTVEANQLNIKPTQVFLLVDYSLQAMQTLKKHPDFNISLEHTEAKFPDSTKPQDVFQAIIAANSQLNQMLATKYSPSDVYRRLEECSEYLNVFHEHFNKVQQVQNDIYKAKLPKDVFKELTECFKLVSQINSLSDVKTVEIDFNLNNSSLTPNDVYSLASLIYSELKYLHALKKLKPVKTTYYPGRKFPAHCFLKAQEVKKQLQSFLQSVQSNPQWLKGK